MNNGGAKSLLLTLWRQKKFNLLSDLASWTFNSEVWAVKTQDTRVITKDSYESRLILAYKIYRLMAVLSWHKLCHNYKKNVSLWKLPIQMLLWLLNWKELLFGPFKSEVLISSVHKIKNYRLNYGFIACKMLHEYLKQIRICDKNLELRRWYSNLLFLTSGQSGSSLDSNEDSLCEEKQAFNFQKMGPPKSYLKMLTN